MENQAPQGVFLDEGTPAPQDQNNAPVSLSEPTEAITTMPSSALANKRSNSINYSLGAVLNKTPSEVYTDVINGRETELRNQASSDVALKAAQQRTKLLDNLTQQTGPVTLDQFKAIYNNDIPNPNTVFEKSFATKYLSALDDAASSTGSTTLSDADSAQVSEMKAKANDLVTKMQIINNMQDNVQDEIQQQGIVPWLADQAKMLFQPYSEYKLRGLNPDAGKVSGGLMLGTNLQSQADDLFKLPNDEFESKLSSIVSGLRQDNPTLASQFLDYVSGVSQSRRLLDNVFTLAAPSDLAAIGKLGTGLLRKASVEARAAKAVKDMVTSAANADGKMPLSAAAAEGAGGVNTAAAIRAQTNLTKQAEGTLDPVTDIVEKLPSNFNLDAQQLANKPGSLSREKLTRLQDSFIQAGQNLADTLRTILRPNRTPLPLDDPEALKAYNERLRQDYKGISNQILDFSPPRHEPVTNTYWVDTHIGSNDGALFSSPDVAKNNAELNGFKNVRIVEAQGAVETEPSQLGGPVRARIRKAQLEGPEGAISRQEKFIKEQRLKAKDTSLSKEAKKEYADTIKSAKEILERYKTELETANSKVYMTDAKIEQNGLGYKYVVSKPYRENDDVVRNYLIKRGDGSYNPDSLSTSSMTGIQSWRNAVTGWFRGADDALSVNEAIQRKAATFSRARIQEWAKAEGEKIEQIASGAYRTDPVTGERIPWYQAKARGFLNKIKQREVYNQFNQTLDYARKAKDPETGDTGYFFKTPGELEDHYMRYYNRMPSFPEVEAYFAHVKLTEADRVFREIAEFRNRAVNGAEQHQISFISNKQRLSSGYFDGVQRNRWPSGNGQVLVMGRNKGDERLAYVSNQKGGFNSTELERYKQGVAEGRYKVIEIYNPSDYPLKSFSDIAGDNYVRYVITDNAESKPLDFNHVNRRGGGHFEYDYDHYIKQANVIPQTVSDSSNDLRRVVSSLYVGDKTLMPISSRALGRDVANKINAVRELLAAGKTEEAEALGRKTLPMEWDEFQSWFKPQKIDGKYVPAKLDVNEPFVVVPRGEKIYDLDKELEKRHSHFQDGTKSGSLAARNQVAYNVERDATGLNTVNRTANGNGAAVFNYEPAEMVDPIPTMNRALNRAINSVFMDDYKQYAVQHWLQEAAPHLLTSQEELNASPFFHFENTIDKSAFKSGTEWATVQNLLLNRMKIKQFVGMPNTFDTAVHSLTQHLIDSAYERGGLTEKFSALPIWMLSKAKDPVQLVRSFAFNAKLGLFNPAQLLVQAQTFANIWALEGRRGALGTYATVLHDIASLNSSKAVLDHLDEMATKFNMFGVKWKAGEFKEARELMNRTGFDQVAGEHQFRDDQLAHKFIKNEWKNFLDAGQIFFRKGEKYTRVGAFYSSYKKFRDLHPVGKITDKDLGEILNYADLLTNNMSRASASNLHSGVLSMTSQFLSYQLHLMELMWGKRLGGTLAERNYARARMFLTYSTLYGIPAASGLVGYPFGDSLREAAIDRGYVVGENWIKSAVMEGLPAYAGFLATGNAYNFGSRFGSQGLTFVQDAMKSDNTIWKLIGGAGLSTVGSTASTVWGNFGKVAATYMTADNKKLAELGAEHTFKVNDFVDMFKEISSVNQAVKAYFAINTGRWISKNEQYIGDVTPLNGIFMSIFGVSPQAQDDTYHKINIQQAEKQAQEIAFKNFKKEYQRGILASKDGDQANANDYMRRAFWWLEAGGYPLDMKAQAIARASKGYESMINSVDYNFATRHVPQGKEDTRMQQYITQQKLGQ